MRHDSSLVVLCQNVTPIIISILTEPRLSSPGLTLDLESWTPQTFLSCQHEDRYYERHPNLDTILSMWGVNVWTRVSALLYYP